MPFNYAIKVARGKEYEAVDELAQKAKEMNSAEASQIQSITSIPSLRGYLIVEAVNFAAVDRLIDGSRYVRGRIKGLVKDDELQKMLVPAPVIDQIKEGYLVEVTGGLLKGMRGKIEFINKAKGEVGISLIGTPNVMPVVVSADSLKVISSEAVKESEGVQNG